MKRHTTKKRNRRLKLEALLRCPWKWPSMMENPRFWSVIYKKRIEAPCESNIMPRIKVHWDKSYTESAWPKCPEQKEKLLSKFQYPVLVPEYKYVTWIPYPFDT